MAQPLFVPYQNVAQANFAFWDRPVLTASNGTYYCPGYEGATYASNLWDTLYLGVPLTQPLTPGICEVSVNKYRDMDKKKSAGKDGARVTFHGVDPAMVEIRITIWTPEQLRQLAALWAILFPPAYKGAPPAYDAQHPMLSIHNIKSLQFIGGDGPMLDQQRRGRFTMRAVEFLKPGKKKATDTKVGSISSLLDSGVTNYLTPGQFPENKNP